MHRHLSDARSHPPVAPPPPPPPTLWVPTDFADDAASEVLLCVVDTGAKMLYANYLNDKVPQYTAARVADAVIELTTVIDLQWRCQCSFHDGGYGDIEGRKQEIDLWTPHITPVKPMSAANHVEQSEIARDVSQRLDETVSVASTDGSSPRRKSSTSAGSHSPIKKRMLKEAVVYKLPEPESPPDVRIAEEARRRSLLRLLEAAPAEEEADTAKLAPERHRSLVAKKKSKRPTTQCTVPPERMVDLDDDAVRIEFRVSDVGAHHASSRQRPASSSHQPAFVEQSSFKDNTSLVRVPADYAGANGRIPSTAISSIESLVLVPGVRIASPLRGEDLTRPASPAAEMPVLLPRKCTPSAKDTERRTVVLENKRGQVFPTGCWGLYHQSKITDRQTQRIPVTRKQPQRGHPQYIVQIVSPPKAAKPSPTHRYVAPGAELV
ncbi:hypothetical protein ACHHYP_02547 [Achlya hypogyna]|uniref:Uncharacterized protein n=1 Tax=Achlya hypogyna TaxID=1202772 RepID=A0A1V9Z671_ACHHY|nr:hypothetical protein ACHHYP_02547 [Achlya hypogyna]